MKVTAVALLAFVGLAAAQTNTSIPACALACIGPTCPTYDVACICSNVAVIGACVTTGCTGADLAAALALASTCCTPQPNKD
jgi:CFEM domain